ncbi:MAG: AI-2E family transporter [Proteocatella sp.]
MLYKIRKNANWIFLALVIFIIYKGVENYTWMFSNLQLLFRILIPFFWGFAIAYILNPLLVKLETKYKMKRLASMLICYAVFFGIIGLFFTIVTPVILRNLFDIIEQLPAYMDSSQIWFNDKVLTLSLVEKLNLQDYIQNNLSEISKMLVEFLNITINGVLGKVIGITSGLLKFIVGIVVSSYMLNEKEKFIISSKKFVFAIYGKKQADKILEFGILSNKVFSNFFIGKTIDSFIVAIICFIGLSLLKAPYALLMSVIVGITNMIPYFGPFIGAVPAVLMTIFVSPIKALGVAIFILILQQVDGNIIGPKILGDKVGISPFYIILSILIGGGFFGMLGMLFAVPLFKIISILTGRYLDYRLERQVLESDKQID